MIKWKYGFLLIVASIFCSESKGQALIALLLGNKVKNDKIHVGIYLGASTSWIANAPGQTPRIGFAIGAYTTYAWKENWEIAIDIVMKSPKGGKKLGYGDSFTVPTDSIFHGEEFNRLQTYLSFAPLIRYKWNPSWGLALGPYFAARIKSKDVYTIHDDKVDQSYTYNSKSDTHLVDVGLSFDMQYVLMKGKGIRINAGFNLGLTNFYKDKAKTAYQRQVLLGVGIPIGQK